MEAITVYTQTVCPYCTRAKNLLSGKGIAFKEINMDDLPDQEWDALQQKTGHKTLPQIFIGEKFVGGFTELATLDSKGELS